MSTWNTPERVALREMVTSFTEKEIAPHLPGWEDAGLLPRELHQKAADVGLFGIGFAEDVGGSGGDIVDATIMTEAVLAGGWPVGPGWVSWLSLCGSVMASSRPPRMTNWSMA